MLLLRLLLLLLLLRLLLPQVMMPIFVTMLLTSNHSAMATAKLPVLWRG